MTLLALQTVSAGYPGGFALQEITFAADRGSVVGIIGPNGAGKSTLLSTLMGDLPVRSGRVLLDGRDLSSVPRRERARLIAVVPQLIDPIAIPLEEYIEMGRLPHRRPLQFFADAKDRRLVAHYLDRVGLGHLRGRYLTELSGGEQQMAAIAQALAAEPELLLLDEATAHLDLTHAAGVLGLIHRLSRDPAHRPGVVAVLHDLTLASEYCDRLLLMKGGRLYAQGTPAEVLTEEHIRAVYGVEATIAPHPLSGRPMVLPHLLEDPDPASPQGAQGRPPEPWSEK